LGGIWYLNNSIPAKQLYLFTFCLFCLTKVLKLSYEVKKHARGTAISCKSTPFTCLVWPKQTNMIYKKQIFNYLLRQKTNEITEEKKKGRKRRGQEKITIKYDNMINILLVAFVYFLISYSYLPQVLYWHYAFYWNYSVTSILLISMYIKISFSFFNLG